MTAIPNEEEEEDDEENEDDDSYEDSSDEEENGECSAEAIAFAKAAKLRAKLLPYLKYCFLVAICPNVLTSHAFEMENATAGVD
jgi:hypothetical protein